MSHEEVPSIDPTNLAAQSQFYSQMKSEQEIRIEETKLDSMLELVSSIENVAKLA